MSKLFAVGLAGCLTILALYAGILAAVAAVVWFIYNHVIAAALGLPHLGFLAVAAVLFVLGVVASLFRGR